MSIKLTRAEKGRIESRVLKMLRGVEKDLKLESLFPGENVFHLRDMEILANMIVDIIQRGVI